MGQFKLIKAAVFSVLFVFANQLLVAQEEADCSDPAFAQLVDRYISASVPTMDVDQLHDSFPGVIILDAREYAEYEVSHIAGAHYVGYDQFDTSALDGIPSNQKILVYCSIGYRSEKIGEKLEKMGYDRVFNLYGGIFEWTNRGYPVVSGGGTTTDSLHGYSKKWSKWATNPQLVKIW